MYVVNRYRLPIFAIACLFASCTAVAQTVTLGELFSLAHDSEPGYRAAQSNVDAARARERQALGAMLPQITATANTNGNGRRYNTLDTHTATLRDHYHSNGNQLSLNQPLWRRANTVALQQAGKATEQAGYQLADTEQQLYLKLATSWFDLMEARDAVDFSTAQRDALRAQWDIARRGAELGAESEPKADDARAKYEEAAADELSAEMDLAAKAAAIEQWIGSSEGLVQPWLREDASIPDLLGDDADAWLAQIDSHCPALRAAATAVAAAEDEISKQRAGYQPTLDMVATFGNTDQNVGNFPGQPGYRIRQLAIGLQLNVPLYSGGAQSAKVAEAIAMREKARDDQESARRQAVLNVKTAFLGWRAGRAKTNAARTAIHSAQRALALAERGTLHGVKTDADVLTARQQLAGARRDVRKGAYQQLTSFIKLKATLGDLSGTDIDELDSLFVAVRADRDRIAAEAGP
ncbi:outer membrane protein [Luteibacter rhizovicinus]|uniref:Outer membrane protein n=1 Tax=Luteibacter rhizovicinus TaxID=242606 RepID=A0A4R3YM67_9GAMM|nr:TolC family protein [Luteibacter rhizovicinus]TCV93351.1 outer membrane protein [Luteibacter rhizovicinus]